MKGVNVTGLKERLPGRYQMSRGGGPKIENPILRAALSAFILAFLCAAFACLIVYRQSTQRVSEVRFDHLRASGSILEKSINLAQHEKIQDSSDASSSAYQSILRSLRKVVKGDPDVRYATTFRWTNGKITYVVDSAGPYEIIQGKKTRGPAIGEVYKEASAKLKECFRLRKPTHDNNPVTNDRGTFISAYVPMENSRGKVVAVVALDMKYSEYKKDFEALQGALVSGLVYSFCFSIVIGIVTAFITWRSGRRTLELSHEVVQTAQKLNRTESELVNALEASKDLSSSLVKTLLTAGCLIWTGSASTKTGKLVWVGELKYDPGFDWLNPLLKMNAKFEDVWASLRSSEDQANWERILSFTIGSRIESTVMEYQLHLPNGTSIWFEEQLALKYEEDGSVHIDAFVQDVTDQKSRTQEVFRLAYYDTVTGLINRTRIHQVINEFLVDRPRVCLIGIEISNFRNINESWGAEIGDKVLKDLAVTLSEGLGQQGIIGRLAGDDFVVIVPDESILSLLVGRIDDLCQRPTIIDGIEVAKVCRLGYAPAEQNESAVSLIRKANLALEFARKNQSPYPVAYKAEMSFRAKMRVELETSMRQALMDREFYLMFQPIYCNKTQRLVKAEALLRWNSSRFGPVSPGTFIPIAEESDFINDIGNFVVDETGKAIHKLEQLTGRTDVVISVNLSLQQLKNQATLNLFNSVIDRWSISPKNMLIEITESSIMHDSNECDVMLNKLQERGFSLAIDDFGTGYSSLATLASLPFDTLKIDKKFVDGIGVDRKQEEVISTIIRLARALNLQIVAEGIEQEPQFEFLRDRDVEYSQGYFFSKPIPFEDLIELAKKEHFRAA
jgi:diguanylate cyclase (GGDEF)-like protein